jgi:YD repeat-containing protein
MKDNQTIAQSLRAHKQILFKVKAFPFIVKDDKGNEIYYEAADGFWIKREYDAKGNPIYYEAADGYWIKCEYDAKGNPIYYEDLNGLIIDKRPKPIVELTLEDIAKLKGVDASQIRIKE